ncbi:MAG TPA: ATP-binding protein [Solirubrobacteraceae bacterium]|nr:ATP-binding protein [Solirubrobacteraceae bacterium]
MCLKRRPSAVGDARRLVRKRLGSALSKETLDDLLVVVSELVTNAVLYGRGDVGLSVRCDGKHVAGEVSDQGAGFVEQQRAHDPTRVGGNGLFMVGRIADSWGLRGGETNVWFEIPLRRRS